MKFGNQVIQLLTTGEGWVVALDKDPFGDTVRSLATGQVYCVTEFFLSLDQPYTQEDVQWVESLIRELDSDEQENQ